MSTILRIFAAGSLRAVWPQLTDRFTAESGIETHTEFAPAGLLRQRIEQGERCDLFASASAQHIESLVSQGLAHRSIPLATNRLCLTARTDRVGHRDDWLSLLQRSALRLATSTPVSDPSGDYTWQLFDRLETDYPGLGDQLRQRAQMLVGGAESLPLPSGSLAAQWLLNNDFADLFIGYASYAHRLERFSSLRVLNIPAKYNVFAHYACAVFSTQAQPLANFLITEQTQQILRSQGFMSPMLHK